MCLESRVGASLDPILDSLDGRNVRTVGSQSRVVLQERINLKRWIHASEAVPSIKEGEVRISQLCTIEYEQTQCKSI